MNQWKTTAGLWGLTLAALVLLTGCPLPGSTSNSNNGGNGSAQYWMLDFGPDPVVAGRREQAKVLIQPFTYSGVFDETSDSPGVYVYDPAGTCSYKLSIGGSIGHNSQGDQWLFQGVTGSGCGMSTLGSGGGTSIGSFPNATSAGGTLTLKTMSPLGTTNDSGNWTGSLMQ